MGLTLITGPARSGKTRTAIERLIEYSPVELAQKVRYVVPTKEAARQVELRLMERLGIRGLVGNVVCTFFSFASEFIAHEGLAARLISDEKKELTLRKLVAESAPAYLGRSAESPGFIRALDQLIGELKGSLVKPADLSRALSVIELPGVSAIKLNEIAELYRVYQDGALVEHELHDREGLMWLARDLARLETAPRFELVVFDGFDIMNATQRSFMKSLVARGQEVLLLLTYESGRDEVFAPSCATREFAIGLKAQEVTVSPVEGDALAQLRAHLFRRTGSAENQDGRLAIIEGCDPLMEVELVAEEILRLVADGCRWSDILVTLRDTGGYQGRIADVFNAADIPLAADKRSLSETTMAKTLMGCIAVVRDHWPRDEVLRLLKSDLLNSDNDAACYVEIAAKNRGLVGGFQAWHDSWRADDPTLDFRLRALGPIDKFDKEIRAAGSLSVMVGAVRSLLDRFDWRKQDDDSLAEDAAAHRRLTELLKELEDSADFLHLHGYQDFFAYFEELIRLSETDAPSSRLETVTVAPAESLGAREYPVVFVLGMLEKVFPRAPREDAFLRDWERKKLNVSLDGCLDYRLAGAAERERFLFYRAASAAQERLYLCYPLTDTEAKDSLPSFYIDEVRRVIETPRLIRRNHAALIPSPDDVFGLPPLRRAAVYALADGEATATAARTYNALSVREPKLLAGVWRDSREREARLIDERILARLAERQKRWSCSELETYALCPFRHFIEKTLRLQQIRDEVDPLDIGSLLHDVLQSLFGDLRAEHGSSLMMERLDSETTISRALMILDEKMKRLPRLAQLAQYEKETLAHDLRIILSRHLNAEIENARIGFIPAYFELEFGRSGASYGEPDPASVEAPYVVETGSGPIELRGKIDRVDIRERADGTTGAVVIDYKSGNQDDVRKYVDGTRIQPFVYLAAAQQLFGWEPLGAEYRPLRTWKPNGMYTESSDILRKKSNRRLTDSELKTVLEECGGIIGDLVERILAGRIEIEPLSCPSYCHLLGVCRHEKGLDDGFQ